MLRRLCPKQQQLTAIISAASAVSGPQMALKTASALPTQISRPATPASPQLLYSTRISRPTATSATASQPSRAIAAAAAAAGLISRQPLLQCSISLPSAAHGALYTSRNVRCFASGDPRSENPDKPTINDLEGGISSEAVGIDNSAIDAIPEESMPAGATRTPGPEHGTKSQPEVDPEAGDPKPEANEPVAGKPRTAGPEVGDSSGQQQPEVQGPPGSVNPDRIPFWGS